MNYLKFSKNSRLLTPQDYKAVFNTPVKKVHSEHFIVFVAQGSGDQARLGLAITKKKIKQAVERNRIKRTTREVFRQRQCQLGSLDMVLIVKNSFIKNYDFRNEIINIFEKIEKFAIYKK